jgi:hypothetical protein
MPLRRASELVCQIAAIDQMSEIALKMSELAHRTAGVHQNRPILVYSD